MENQDGSCHKVEWAEECRILSGQMTLSYVCFLRAEETLSYLRASPSHGILKHKDALQSKCHSTVYVNVLLLIWPHCQLVMLISILELMDTSQLIRLQRFGISCSEVLCAWLKLHSRFHYTKQKQYSVTSEFQLIELESYQNFQ